MKAVANYFISKEYLIASKQHISPKKARIYLYGKIDEILQLVNLIDLS